MTTRAERVASNQALFRMANERRLAWPERQDRDSAEGMKYFCECADTRCREQVGMAPDEYEAVRADPRRFVVAPGHVYPEAERVAEEHEDYAVVEKFQKVAHVVEATDPRS
jgi:hypothetical protein